MSRISLSEDIRSVTELKRNTRDILDHLHATGRPVILTVNGKADSVLLDVHVYEKTTACRKFCETSCAGRAGCRKLPDRLCQ